MKRVILIRHFKSEANEKHLLHGHSNCDLLYPIDEKVSSATAQAVAKAIDKLPPEKVLWASSDLLRAKHTKRHIQNVLGHSQKSANELLALRERHFGSYEGSNYRELYHQIESGQSQLKLVHFCSCCKEHARLEGGDMETWMQVYQRSQMAKRVLEQRAQRNGAEAVVIVTHGDILPHLIGLFSGRNGWRECLEAQPHFHQNGHVEVIDL